MYQPNYLEIDTKLAAALAFCERHPELRSAEYGPAVRSVLERFRQVTRETDAHYTEWRVLLGKQLTAFKQARLSYDRGVALADEHGYDDFPRRKIVYTEEEHLLRLLADAMAWLKPREGEWPWIAELHGALQRHVQEAKQIRRQTDHVYQDYTHIIKRRVRAYQDSVAMLREFLRDVRAEGSFVEEAKAFTLDLG